VIVPEENLARRGKGLLGWVYGHEELREKDNMNEKREAGPPVSGGKGKDHVQPGRKASSGQGKEIKKRLPRPEEILKEKAGNLPILDNP